MPYPQHVQLASGRDWMVSPMAYQWNSARQPLKPLQRLITTVKNDRSVLGSDIYKILDDKTRPFTVQEVATARRSEHRTLMAARRRRLRDALGEYTFMKQTSFKRPVHHAHPRIRYQYLTGTVSTKEVRRSLIEDNFYCELVRQLREKGYSINGTIARLGQAISDYSHCEYVAQDLLQLFGAAVSDFKSYYSEKKRLHKAGHPDLGWNFVGLGAVQQFLHDEINRSIDLQPKILGILIQLEMTAKEADVTLQFAPSTKAFSRVQWKIKNDTYWADCEMSDAPDLASSQGSTASLGQSVGSFGVSTNSFGTSTSSTSSSTPAPWMPSNQPVQTPLRLETFKSQSKLISSLMDYQHLLALLFEFRGLREKLLNCHVLNIQSDHYRLMEQDVVSFLGAQTGQWTFKAQTFCIAAEDWLAVVIEVRDFMNVALHLGHGTNVLSFKQDLDKVLDIVRPYRIPDPFAGVPYSVPPNNPQLRLSTHPDNTVMAAQAGNVSPVPAATTTGAPVPVVQTSAAQVSVATSSSGTNWRSSPLFDDDFDSLDSCIKALSNETFVEEVQQNAKELKNRGGKKDMITPGMILLLAASIASVKKAHEKSWFHGPQIVRDASSWAYIMKNLKTALASPGWQAQRENSQSLKEFYKNLLDVLASLAEAPKGPANPPPPPDGGNDDGSRGLSGPSSGCSGTYAPLSNPAGFGGCSAPAAGFSGFAATYRTTVAGTSGTQARTTFPPGLTRTVNNTFTIFKTTPQPSGADNAPQDYVDKGKGMAGDPQPIPNYVNAGSNEVYDNDKIPAIQPTREDEPFKAGSTPVTYNKTAVFAASEDDIKKGNGAYAVASVTSHEHLKAIYAHPSFLKIILAAQKALLHKTANKMDISFEDVRILRRACTYIIQSAKQLWYSYRNLQDGAELVHWQSCMNVLVGNHLSYMHLTDNDLNHEALQLGKEIKTAGKRLEGEMEAPAKPRVQAQPRRRPART